VDPKPIESQKTQTETVERKKTTKIESLEKTTPEVKDMKVVNELEEIPRSKTVEGSEPLKKKVTTNLP
jgi:hypothetical protein